MKENKPKENKPENNDSNLEEIESANFFRFENLGDTVQGVLKDVQKSKQFGFGIYTLEQDDGSPVRIHGSSDLDDKMMLLENGQWVKITYYDQKQQAKGIMKLFRVQKRKTLK